MKKLWLLTTIKVVLPDKMEVKVYVFTDRTHEQFLAHIMKSVSLIGKQQLHFDQLKMADVVLEEAIQEATPRRKSLKGSSR